MSSCLRGGGGRAYRIKTLDLEVIKSPSTSWISNSSSPSSTLSESSNNCPLAISTRKPRTPRKRPNQTYNEAAAILSTAYPKIFPTKNHLTKPCKFTKSEDDSIKNQFLLEPSDLLMPFRVIDNSPGFLLHPPPLLDVGPNFSGDPSPKGLNLFEKVCQSPGEINSQVNSVSEICDEYREDFDAESMLDEEIGAGIDSIMGDSGVENESNEGLNICNNVQMNGFCYGYPVGLGFEFGNGLRREMRAMRNVDEGDWWRFPSVNVLDLAPAIAKSPPAEKKKKKKVEKCVEMKNSEPPAVEDSISNPKSAGEEDDSISIPKPIAGLLLKLNYDTVLNAWCDKGSPFAGDSPAADGNDIQVRLAQIDLFSENGGIREASVLRYKEKRRTRLFSKKIRYQVRKVNADRRPRMKGRFVRTPNSSED